MTSDTLERAPFTQARICRAVARVWRIASGASR
jgi:hypothetical protein